jgi:hypothetical protein
VTWAALYVALAAGSLDDASHCIDEATALSSALGQELTLHGMVALTFMALFRASVALLRGDLGGAEPHYRTALNWAGRLGDEALLGLVLSLRGLVQLALGDTTGGRRSILDAAVANRRSGSPWTIANSLEGLAAVALEGSRPDVAARALAAAAAARRHVPMPIAAALRPLVDDLALRSRQRLSPEAYEAASSEGEHWPLLQALDRTLEGISIADRPLDTG